jgi:hypothetical protein
LKILTIIADSIASLPPNIVKKYDLKILSFHVSFNGKQYRDGIDPLSRKHRNNCGCLLHGKIATIFPFIYLNYCSSITAQGFHADCF